MKNPFIKTLSSKDGTAAISKILNYLAFESMLFTLAENYVEKDAYGCWEFLKITHEGNKAILMLLPEIDEYNFINGNNYFEGKLTRFSCSVVLNLYALSSLCIRLAEKKRNTSEIARMHHVITDFAYSEDSPLTKEEKILMLKALD